MILNVLTAFSTRYGSDPELVLAGGGNTSAKEDGVLYVKASGTALSHITKDGFVAMDRAKLRAIMDKTYPSDDGPREQAALADLMDARLPGQGSKRPSVETLLHSLFPMRYVLHLHPALVNGMTCARDGAAWCAKLFPDAVWIGESKPGYMLAKNCKTVLDAYHAAYGRDASLLFLQNHGVFFSADDPQTLDDMLQHVLQTLRKQCDILPDLTDTVCADTAFSKALAELYGSNAVCRFSGCADALHFAESKDTMTPLREPFTPDHIVYCRAHPLYLADTKNAADAFAQYRTAHGYAPRVVFVRGQGVYTVAESDSRADTALQLALDSIKIARYAENFGGASPQRPALTDFIVHWEVEAYRAKQAK